MRGRCKAWFTWRLVLAGCVLAAGCTASGPSEDRDGLQVPRARDDIVLDGEIGPDEWENAQRRSGRFVLSAGDTAHAYAFVLYLQHQGANLDVALDVEQLGENPLSNDTSTYAWNFFLFFAPSSGPLPRGSTMAVVTDLRSAGATFLDVARWDGSAWEYVESGPGNAHHRGGRDGGSTTWELTIPLDEIGLGEGRTLATEGAGRFLVALAMGEPDQPRDVDERIRGTYPAGSEGAPLSSKDPASWASLSIAPPAAQT